MKSQAVFVTNYEELEKSETMNIPWKPETTEYPFLFDIKDVKAAYKDKEGDIIVYLEVVAEETQWRLRYNKELWEKLETKFA